jgi:hypothetical protein
MMNCFRNGKHQRINGDLIPPRFMALKLKTMLEPVSFVDHAFASLVSVSRSISLTDGYMASASVAFWAMQNVAPPETIHYTHLPDGYHVETFICS